MGRPNSHVSLEKHSVEFPVAAATGPDGAESTDRSCSTDDWAMRGANRGVIATIGNLAPQTLGFELPSGSVPLKSYLENIEITLIRRALRENNGVIAHAARFLQIRRTTLAEKMKRYGMSATEPDPDEQ